jgi:hypothetical protein
LRCSALLYMAKLNSNKAMQYQQQLHASNLADIINLATHIATAWSAMKFGLKACSAPAVKGLGRAPDSARVSACRRMGRLQQQQ